MVLHMHNSAGTRSANWLRFYARRYDENGFQVDFSNPFKSSIVDRYSVVLLGPCPEAELVTR